MSSSYATERPANTGPAPDTTGWIGLVVFAGIMMLILGTFQVAEGVTALYREEVYLVTADGHLLDLDYTVWGWVHLVFGLITLASGAGILLGQTWARVTGIIIAGIGALLHFSFLAAAPVWCSILICMDILVIYALAAHGRDVRRKR
ncbi:hypothetical protein FB565_000997 [Actinoplanes lutulentus]|uniref:DUF7144 domain-containing protein n=1 Tax=Actinoplanes lutulentus TaxID=1287878 RepID=A0A327ZCT7_9ACTN|nr:hypothetical protein [Actinoplanes lutulentus]MBB2941293.1 hypothetical protein [Actinoplanes lutulentus]RAK36785.1 hypothetical protein B0I29_10747 [Actinoplanes lutulentus]